MYKNILEKSGLKKGEAEVYDILLQFGNLSASEIVSKTKYKRGMVYKFLDDLKSKSLISTLSKNKKTYFKPEHPYKIMSTIENTLKETKAQETSLEAALPQLISTFNAIENKPGVRIYEGIEGIKEIYLDTIRDKKEIFAILQTSEVEPTLYSWLTKQYAPLRAKENIWAKVIAADDKKTADYVGKNEKEKRETKIVYKKKFPVAVEMNIYGNKVAFMNFKKGTDYMGIIINNKQIADTMKSLFNLAWDNQLLN